MNGVVMLVNEFPPLPIGGAERQAERLAQFLAGQGWDIRVLTRGAAGVPARQHKDGYQVLRVRPRGPGKIKTATFVLGALGTLWRERHHYQILHAHLAFGPAFAAALVGRLLGKAVIVKFGNSGQFGDVQSSQKTWRGRLRLAALRRWANVVITLDEKMQAEALAAGFAERQIRRMPNGIDSRIFHACPDKEAAKIALGLPLALTIIYTGRLNKQKSLDTLILAMYAAEQQIPNLQLLLVGDGPERHNLVMLAQELDLADRVHFTGAVGDVSPYLAAADLFVLPSLSEGISNSLLEAMASGLACIATRVGGTADVLGPAGVIIPPRHPDGLALEIVRLAQHPSEIARLGLAARQRIAAEYDFEIVGARYIELYRRLMGSFQQDGNVPGGTA
jgi:glycosyltransferase involved in cell wall biosynthesis